MTETTLNIVDLIENNPITRISNTYNSSLLTKIKAKFTDQEQQMFVGSFYCYLNYNGKEDYVIDLDNVWKWLGFSQKYNAKHLLEKQFSIDIDYKIIAPEHSGAKKNIRGGHNKETIMLNIDAFKKLCLKAGTKKADTIHEYYIKLENILQEIMYEESNELKLQLQKQIIHSEKEKEKVREKTILEQFPSNTQCVYYGFIDNESDKKERLVKFGNSNNLKCRIYTHKKTYLNFRLVNAFKVENKIQIETAIKDHILLKDRQRTISLNSKKYVELLSIEELTLEELDKIIKEIINSIQYNQENYNKLLDENKELKKKLETANKVNNNESVFILETENARLKLENIKLIKRYNSLSNKYGGTTIEVDTPIITSDEIKNYGNVIPTLKKNIKNIYGTYDIGGKNYTKLEGTRQEVWDGIAYQTSGALKINNFIINKNGNIVSKRKSIIETDKNRFVKFGIGI